MQALQDREEMFNEEKKLFTCLVDLLSYEKITFNGELKFKFLLKSRLFGERVKRLGKTCDLLIKKRVENRL
jgi:hypothetical protein